MRNGKYIPGQYGRDVVYSTPDSLFSRLDAEFGFTTDVCALPENSKCPHFYTPEQDGLKQEWTGVCWMNPPFGRGIEHWLKKAFESKCVVVAIVPGRTSSPWWHDYVMHAAEIRFLRSKTYFRKPDGTKYIPFLGMVVVVFKPGRYVQRFSSMRQT